MTMLGMPSVPSSSMLGDGSEAIRFTTGHHFSLLQGAEMETLGRSATVPLSVILQVTKRCDFDCVFCSETLRMKDPTLAQLTTMSANLKGVKRVFLSGGEPLLRRDLLDVVDAFQPYIIGLPTNATRGIEMARRLSGSIQFVNVGFDGPREIFRRVRGDYDKTLNGVYAFRDAGIPISFSAVVLRSTLYGLPYLVQIADVLGAGKVKLILPLRKGNALDLAAHEFISVEEAREHFDRLNELRNTHGWQPAIRMTPWTTATEGHMIVIEPNGNVQAWPVYDQPDLFLRLGNILDEPITRLWERYPFKLNHYAKYLGTSIFTCNRAA
jgi:MoaA/NifB/PqqE/SkfB family radical SAM enzyme